LIDLIHFGQSFSFFVHVQTETKVLALNATGNWTAGTCLSSVQQYGTVGFLTWHRFDIFASFVGIDQSQENYVGQMTERRAGDEPDEEKRKVSMTFHSAIVSIITRTSNRWLPGPANSSGCLDPPG